MAGWGDLGAAFNTLRELDVAAIKDEAERPLQIACVGAPAVCRALADQLEAGGGRYGMVAPSPLRLLGLSEVVAAELRSVDLVLIGLAGAGRLAPRELAAIDALAALALPTVVVVWGAALPADAGPPHPRVAHARIVAIADPAAAGEALAEALLDRLPGDLQLAAARRLPGLRAALARQLIGGVAFTNASYALASALPEQVPILSLPFAAADILVLTKNQVLLVYRIGLAYGAPPDLSDRLRELLPVLGGAYAWRQLARSLVGLIPVWGIAPKVAIAYAGTYTTGSAAWRWFADGELLSRERLAQLGQEALTIGRERAGELIAGARSQGERQIGVAQRLWGRLRARLPGGRAEG